MALAILLIVAAVSLGIVGDRTLDPLIDGKPLRTYLAALPSTDRLISHKWPDRGLPKLGVDESPRGDVIAAVDAAGTNALPLLTRMLGSRARPFNQWLWTKLQTHPRLRGAYPGDHPARVAYRQQVCAVWAIQRLGPRAAPMLPAIVELLTEPDCSDAAIWAFHAISPTRPADILQLTNRFSISRLASYGPSAEDTSIGHAAAMMALAAAGTNAAGAGGYFLNFMDSTNSLLRGSAAVACAETGIPAKLAVPLIIADIQKQLARYQTRTLPGSAQALDAFPYQSEALARYGREATNALPVLKSVFDAHVELKRFASDAMEEIRDPTPEHLRK